MFPHVERFVLFDAFFDCLSSLSNKRKAEQKRTLGRPPQRPQWWPTVVECQLLCDVNTQEKRVLFALSCFPFSRCALLFSKKYRINKTHSMWQKFGFCFGLYDLSDEAVGLSSCINWKCFIFIQVRMSLLWIEVSFFRMKAWILASGTLPIGNGILYTRGLCEEDAVYIPTPQGHQLVH